MFASYPLFACGNHLEIELILSRQYASESALVTLAGDAAYDANFNEDDYELTNCEYHIHKVLPPAQHLDWAYDAISKGSMRIPLRVPESRQIANLG